MAATAPNTVREFCELLSHSKLMNLEEIQGLSKHWQNASKPADDIEGFRKLLVANRYLTEYQAALIARGRSDGFFFGDYKILEKIGKGRFSGVYKAIHKSGQVIAIKVLPASKASDPKVLARFKRESRFLTRLNHPNLIRAFQTGEIDGRHFIVTEFLEGETLAELLEKRNKIPPIEACRLIHQILLGLQHVHEKGMVHRDIRPDNVMVVDPLLGGSSSSPNDTLRKTVKILDLGLGRATFDEEAPSDEPSELTSAGALLGSANYLAPEQARDATSADIRADIYSVGCILYQLITGRLPFVDETTIGQILKHAQEPVPQLAQVVSSVPAGLQPILEKMMAKFPQQRYPTPQAAADALEVYTRTAPSVTPTPAPLKQYMDYLYEAGHLEEEKPAAQTTRSSTLDQKPTPAAAPIPVGKVEPTRKGGGPHPASSTTNVPVKPTNKLPAPVVQPLVSDVELVDVELVEPNQLKSSGVATPAVKPVEPNQLKSSGVATPAVKPVAPPQALTPSFQPLNAPPSDEEEERSLFELDRRDYIMVTTGAILTGLGIGLGYGLSRLLRGKKPDPTQQPIEEPKEKEPDAKEKPKEKQPKEKEPDEMKKEPDGKDKPKEKEPKEKEPDEMKKEPKEKDPK
jgi:serine/threonine protein kinase